MTATRDDAPSLPARAFRYFKEYASNALIGGLFLLGTGFAPEQWVTKVLGGFGVLHDSPLEQWLLRADLRFVAVIVGMLVIVGDVLYRHARGHRQQLQFAGAEFGGTGDSAQGVGAAAISMPVEPLSLPARPSIAVLPFTNMSGDPEQEYFGDGVSEEILTALSRCTWLFVVARNSSFIYKGKSVDVRQVSHELGVRYVLEGSVRRVGNKIRFTAQLIDATAGAHIWADKFDGEYNDIFELQDRVAECVVAAIEPNLQIAEVERIKSKPAKNLDAFDLLLKAQRLEHTFTEESVLEAIKDLEEALEIDPLYAPAMALAGYCYGERRFQGWTRNIEEETRKGLQYARRAVELAPDDANVLYMAALAVWQLGSDIRYAKELSDRSLLMNPNSAIASTIAGWIEAYGGNFDNGLSLLQRAQRLNPRDPRAWLTAAGMSIAYLGKGEFDDGALWAKKALVQNPRYTVAMRLLAANAANAGRPHDGKDAVDYMLQIEPGLTLAALGRRLSYMDRGLWNNLVNGLRAAGLPEG